jgi:L-aspartate oxidase
MLLPLATASDPAAVGLMIAAAASLREESRGAHYRADFTNRARVARRSAITLDTALRAAQEMAHSPLLEEAM